MTIVPSSSSTLRGIPKALRASKALGVGEAQRAAFESLAQHPVLRLQILDDTQLLAADPTSNQKYQERERRRLGCHAASLAQGVAAYPAHLARISGRYAHVMSHAPSHCASQLDVSWYGSAQIGPVAREVE